MAISGVFMTDTDGNLGSQLPVSTENVCGLIFDISAQDSFWESGAGSTASQHLKDTVVELNFLEDAEKVGITPFTDGGENDLLHGIPYYHISHFFGLAGGSGRLFVMFADCSSNWNAIVDMQKAANGMISQIGIWTEQNLWKMPDSDYAVQIVGDLQGIAESLANDYHAPVSLLLSANTAKLATSSEPENTITWSKIPSCQVNARYVSVLLGQAMDVQVTKMQMALESCTPVGCVGAALGCLARANVAESIGWVDQYDLVSFIPDIEFGFGDSTPAESKLTNSTKYSSLTKAQIEHLDTMGYIYLTKYEGYSGHIFFSGDPTCDNGDYRTISRNRAINKSRRVVRTVLLPYVNSPLKIAPSTGQLSAAQITIFKNAVDTVLQAMADANEINGFATTIPTTQNVLATDTLQLSYKLVPIGTAKQITVTEGLALKV